MQKLRRLALPRVLSDLDSSEIPVHGQQEGSAYKPATVVRSRLALLASICHGSLTTLWEKQIKIGVKVVRHARYVTFQMVKIAIPHHLFASHMEIVSDSAVTARKAVFGTRAHGRWRQRDAVRSSK